MQHDTTSKKMVDVVDARNVENVCRLCLSMEEPKSSVFADQASSVSLATKIQACLSIEILASDKVSTLICAECLTRVNKWHVYKEYCLRSQQKLQQCLGDQLENLPNIKIEPMDICEPPSPLETVPLTSDDEPESLTSHHNDVIPTISLSVNNNQEIQHPMTTIKREPPDEIHPIVEIEQLASPELLLNPMAITGHKDDRLMEADSTQKLVKNTRISKIKKKPRRGPHTHYRGPGRQYKRRCPHCQIYLHSKTSYGRHMERFHSNKIIDRKPPKRPSNTIIMDLEKIGFPEINENHPDEMIEDVEDELASLEKDSPLTPVQQNIISQLKTFSCYSCRQSFNDRRNTLNHIRQHMPDLRPYTCIACLTEFADRSIYKLHCGASFQCAMKIALVTPEHGTEKYFTCNMCLKSLPDRRELLSHLAKHSDKQYEQMLARPFNSPPKLKPMTKIISPKKEITSMSEKIAGTSNSSPTKLNKSIPEPYKNGDPAFNHKCECCGMIYKYKQNMHKHLSLCKKLPSEVRTCYQCVHCGLTFLAFNKFIAHHNNDHKRRNIICSLCRKKFKDPNDYLQHYRDICGAEIRRANEKPTIMKFHVKPLRTKIFDDKRMAVSGGQMNDQRWRCTICESTFPTRSKLYEHKKIHSRQPVHTCTMCHCTFAKASSLEAHMAEHDIEIFNVSHKANKSVPPLDNGRINDDTANTSNFSLQSDPGVNTTDCHECGKSFSTNTNFRRHFRSVHDTIGRFSCFTCATTFVLEEQWREHIEIEHSDTRMAFNCPLCPEIFITEQKLNNHRQIIHGTNDDNHLGCYICGKIFANETSLKIHRGHHFRVNTRMSIGNSPNRDKIEKKHEPTKSMMIEVKKSPTARKSFPNSSSPQRQTSSSMSTLQCQVCDDRFNDVSDLRKHLWDVHCARTKPEKNYTMHKYQCELCTNVMPDEESLTSHMKWHKNNPILSNYDKFETPEVQCDFCGKFYSNMASLRKHKKNHKIDDNSEIGHFSETKRRPRIGYTCGICDKVFAVKITLDRHKQVAHNGSYTMDEVTTPKRHSSPVKIQDTSIKPIRPKFDFDAIVTNHSVIAQSSRIDAKKPITCNLCRRVVPGIRALYKHRQRVHKITIDDDHTMLNDDYYNAERNDDSACCTICGKTFSNLSNMKQHFTKVHGTGRTGPQFKCAFDGCKLQFKNRLAKENHEKIHSNGMYRCTLCPRHMTNRAALNEHMINAHKTNYTEERRKSVSWKNIDLDNYVVKGANGRQCPICKIIYPNHKALKIHYLKIHEGA